jgi:diguanylate cyclase (GGDEF)-like protein
VQECGKSAQVVRDDTDMVRLLLASDTPVILLLASEYVSAIHPLTRAELDRSLAHLGFTGVETTVLGEEIVAAAYDQTFTAMSYGPPRLRSTCPVTVDWVRRFYPQLTGALMPIIPPYIAQARLVRALYPSDIAIVYASPCYSRKDEVFQKEVAGDIDVAIGFDELRALISEVPPQPVGNRSARKPQVSKVLSAIDGFPRRMISATNCTNGTVTTVRGLDELDRLLSAIVRGETAPGIVDMLCCEGCLDGPCVNQELSVFAKRAIDVSERKREAPPAVDTRTLLSALPTIDLGRTFAADPAPFREPTAAQVDEVLTAGEFMSRDDHLDCGACGRPTCVEQAVAIWMGNSTWDLCFPLQKKLLVRECEHHAEASVTDDLTGLMNRRAFDRRLSEEVDRAARYGTPLSLIMIDLDVFKSVNDRFGHATGDMLLRAFGQLLRAELRATDVAVRYGGDEFALVLPGINKTGAWAVAEKICGRLRNLDWGLDQAIRSTASMGVASLSDPPVEASVLLELADAALYRAKRAGRDRVELAAG